VALAIFEGCPAGWLDDPEAIRAALAEAVRAGSFTHHETVVVRFQPQGVTGCAVVGESHLALHSWPEEGRLFFDVASCSTAESVTRAVRSMEASLPEGRLTLLEERVLDPSSDPR